MNENVEEGISLVSYLRIFLIALGISSIICVADIGAPSDASNAA
jgi:hypothetical protein